jgi:predicted secreted protein
MEARPPRPPAAARRTVLVLGAALGLAAIRRRPALGGPPPARAEGGLIPRVQVPPATGNGAKVPIAVELDHPMLADHHVTTIAAVNPRDPVPAKGTFHFTPRSGGAYVAWQVRLDEGEQTVEVAGACSRGARFAAAGAVRVAAGAGGCAGAGPAPARRAAAARAPVIRIPQLVRGEPLAPNQVVVVQVLIPHPVWTGLGLRGGQYAQVSEPFYLTEVEVFLGAARVSRFELTPALADDPLITFRLRADAEEMLRVLARNSRGQELEAAHPVRFG